MGFSFSGLFSRIKEIILNPKRFWSAKKDDQESLSEIWWSFFIPLLLALSVAVFTGEFFKRSDFFVEYPVLKALKITVLYVLQYLISAFLTNELIKTFGGSKNMVLVRKLVIFSMTPLLLVSLVTGLFPFLYVMDILGIYSLYIFWIGAKELIDIPENKKNSYVLITLVTNFFVFGFLSLFLSKLLIAYY